MKDPKKIFKHTVRREQKAKRYNLVDNGKSYFIQNKQKEYIEFESAEQLLVAIKTMGEYVPYDDYENHKNYVFTLIGKLETDLRLIDDLGTELDRLIADIIAQHYLMCAILIYDYKDIERMVDINKIVIDNKIVNVRGITINDIKVEGTAGDKIAYMIIQFAMRSYCWV